MERIRVTVVAVALAIPSAVFALDALVSVRERGIVEPLDIPAAIAFAALASLVWRGSRVARLCATALIAVYLVTAGASGVGAFVVYLALAVVPALQALPVIGHLTPRAAA